MKQPKSPLFQDMAGLQYGLWTVIAYKGGGAWLCKCACGKESVVGGQSLRRGTSGSCGCSRTHRTLEEEFLSRLVKLGKDECWPWKGRETGYGQLMFNRKNHSAHRVSWQVFNGAIAEGLDVLHSCDNPPCVNPAHLFLGTNLDNIADKMAKGRHRSPIGEAHGSSKLNADKVIQIRRRSGEGASALGRDFRVSEATVRDVLNFKTWRHVLDLLLGKE